ncbi:hypothetical protein TcCL_ESM02051 [Trypanosoma cruzi]|nr:hypothetical protein TcCL_ESM02051 [Trypanosoma cruzi]
MRLGEASSHAPQKKERAKHSGRPQLGSLYPTSPIIQRKFTQHPRTPVNQTGPKFIHDSQARCELTKWQSLQVPPQLPDSSPREESRRRWLGQQMEQKLHSPPSNAIPLTTNIRISIKSQGMHPRRVIIGSAPSGHKFLPQARSKQD